METIRWPSDNDWDIPTLDKTMQAERVALPLRGWGSSSRREKAPGAWHFFIDDYRFSRVLTAPMSVVDTQPTWCCEPNISIADDDPAAQVLWTIYRKRWISRLWQSHGIPVAVDVNVPPRFQAMNLLGVPHGWKAFATRGKAAELDVLRDEYSRAEERAGCVPLFVVIGGGQTVADECRMLPGAVWIAGGQW